MTRRVGHYWIKRCPEEGWSIAVWAPSPYPADGMCWIFWDRTIHRGRVHRVGPHIKEPPT